MILLLGIQSVGYVRQLSRATGTILADNYNSLQYAGEMLRSLNDIGQDSISRHALRENLALQQQNITEISEKETTAALERHVASLSDPVTEAEIRTVREDLFRIMELNMAAIRAKSAGVEQRADYAMWWLIAVAALCALIAGGILVWFPQSVLRPIDALKKGITQIANHNYRERLDFPGNREFESVAESFNDMAAKLDEYRRSSLDDLMTAKKRIEAIVDTLHEPIVGLGPDRRILFMNREAFSVLNLREDAVGRDAAEVALSNDLLRRLVRGVNDTKKDADKEPLKIYADNKESYFQVENTPLYITPVGGREQQFVGNLIVLNNVTRFKELDSAKTNFISTVSHEMKTPISSGAASTRVTTRASSSAISASREPRCRAAGWGWPSRRSSSKRTAARSRSRAKSAAAAASRFCSRPEKLPAARFGDCSERREQTKFLTPSAPSVGVLP